MAIYIICHWQALATAALKTVGAGLGFVQGMFDRKESKRQHDSALQVTKENHERQDFWNQQNFDEQRRQYEQNFASMQEQQQYDRGLQQQIFDREDNATQRRVSDMRAAGINPVLAAGNAANAGGIVSSTAPTMEAAQRGYAPDESAGVHMSRAKQKLQEGIARNAATMELFGNVSGVMLDVLHRQAEIEHTQADTDRIKAEAGDLPAAAIDRRTQATAAMENANHAGTQANAAIANVMQRARENDLKELNSLFERRESAERHKAAEMDNYIRANSLYRELEWVMQGYNIDKHDWDRTIQMGLRTFDSMTEEQKWISMPAEMRRSARISDALDRVTDIGSRAIENLIDTVTGQSSGRQDMRRGQRANRTRR